VQELPELGIGFVVSAKCAQRLDARRGALLRQRAARESALVFGEG
jgi:hypothetical protein